MSILTQIGPNEFTDLKLVPNNKGKIDAPISDYKPNAEEKQVRQMIITNFATGSTTMYKPRAEFNDLSTISRTNIDQMAFNTYQPNNGDAVEGDMINSWKSRAVKPIVRNKIISIAAHATARLIFPKVFAYDQDSEEQSDSADVMEDLMEWSADQSNYEYYSLQRTMSALTDPASIGFTEYTEIYRNVKRQKDDMGKWKIESMLDTTVSGFQNISVPVDQLFIENFYEPDIQKQGWLIWRRVLSYSLAESMYMDRANWKYIHPGVQIIYNDANQSFYQVYDTNMRQDCVEEVRYWNKNLDLYLVLVNGVLLTDSDNPNPRVDKLYPFDKFGYELINSRCFYYKSLAFKMGPEANIINTLYPMIIDGTYLNLMPPMINVGGQIIGSDVIVPGAVTTLEDPNSDLKAITLSTNLKAGMDTLFKVEDSINQSSEDPVLQGQPQSGDTTAYATSRIEQNANTVLGLFIKMIGQHVRDFGKLRMGDILQYLTIIDAAKITDNADLIYKTFLLKDKSSNGRNVSRKIKFDSTVPSEPTTPKQKLDLSYQTLEEQGGPDSKTELYKVNPQLFRDLTFMLNISPDVLNPRSEELERAMKLEIFDRAIQLGPAIDQEAVTRDFLFGAYEGTVKDPKKYVNKQPQGQPAMGPQQPQPAGQPGLGSNALAEVAKSSNATNTFGNNPTPSIKI